MSDARPTEAFEVHVEVRAVDGVATASQILAVLEQAGFELHRDRAGVWRKKEHGPAEFEGVARAA
ncbi:hypothetical protein [Verrucosispora sp. WMMD1129]|uniref:hypothetical protein n=1 Tax=Verrucosispora sp. WMMD1129 TaxID=3016093 RepID=UPI00249AB0AB|nr:hypothetical protein [Verrucosispora sp. WMMD1129]WFE47615.1 hypothetical protein O7624_26480 [Verrucosispora sp. WMMD1129]